MKTKKIGLFGIILICICASLFIGCAATSGIAISNNISYNVGFIESGGSAVPDQQVKRKSHVSEPVCTKRGYTLDSWKNGSTKWNFEKDVVTSDIKLTASWSLETYTITYNYDGGIGNNPTSYTIKSDIDLSAPVKEGYEFAGYFDQYNNLVTKIEKGTTGDLVLTAKYSQITYNVNVHCDYQFGRTYGSGNYAKGETVRISFEPNINYIFNGWYSNTEGKYLSYDTIYYFQMPAKNLNISAICNRKQFNVTYIDSLGVSNTNPTTCFTNESYTLKDLSHQDYDFLGWYNEENVKVTTINSSDTKDIVLTASWAKKEYSLNVIYKQTAFEVEYYGTHMWGDTVTVKATKIGHSDIDCWRGSDGKNYGNTNVITFEMPKYDLDLSLLLDAKQYNITYKNCDGLDNPNPTKLTYSVGYVLKDVVHPEYPFVGWFDADGNQYKELSSYEGGDLVLYAKFKLPVYKVTCANDSSEFTISGTGTYEKGTNATLKATKKSNNKLPQFACFTSGNEVACLYDEYSFEVNSDTNITAHVTDNVSFYYFSKIGSEETIKLYGNDDSTLKTTTIRRYDDNNNETYYRCEYTNYSYTVDSEYNSKNLKTKETRTYNRSGTISTTYTTYQYDSNDRLISTDGTYSSDKVKYTYDDEGNLIQKVINNSTTYNYTYSTIYEGDYKKVRVSSYDDPEYNWKSPMYLYDSTGRLVQYWDNEGQVTYYNQRYTFDSKGRVTHIDGYSAHIYAIDNVYDDDGNLVYSQNLCDKNYRGCCLDSYWFYEYNENGEMIFSREVGVAYNNYELYDYYIELTYYSYLD